MILGKLGTIGRDLDNTLRKLRDVQRERSRTQPGATEIILRSTPTDLDALVTSIQTDELAR